MPARPRCGPCRISDLLEEVGGHGTLLVRRSKTDGEGQGEIVWVGPDSLRLVKRWRKRAGVGDGYLFRSLDKGGTVLGALPPGQVARIFKRMARRAGLPDRRPAGRGGLDRGGRVDRPRGQVHDGHVDGGDHHRAQGHDRLPGAGARREPRRAGAVVGVGLGHHWRGDGRSAGRGAGVQLRAGNQPKLASSN